jgi:hypothetical protein
VPDVTVYGVGSWKSTHEKLVPMLTAEDCCSSAPAEPPLVAYSAAMAFPDDAPSM